MKSQSTVLFEEPFWIAIFEVWDHTQYGVCRVVLGKEPTSSEFYEWMLSHYSELHFKQKEVEAAKEIHKMNPKKLKKQIAHQVSGRYQGTKAQQTLQSMHEEEKVERKKLSRERKEAMEKARFKQKQEKKKQKKRGH